MEQLNICTIYIIIKKITDINKIYKLLEEQSKTICDLEFKIKEIENPQTDFGYELIEMNQQN